MLARTNRPIPLSSWALNGWHPSPPPFVLVSLFPFIRFVDPPMRKIGTVETRVAAQRFCDFLVTQGIASSLDPADPARPDAVQSLWIKEETKVVQAREMLTEFVKNPNDGRYAVDAAAAKLRAEQEALNRKTTACSARYGSDGATATAMQRPITILVLIGVCVTLGVLTDFGSPKARISRDGRLVVSSEATALDLFPSDRAKMQRRHPIRLSPSKKVSGGD